MINRDAAEQSFLRSLIAQRHLSAATRSVYRREIGFFSSYVTDNNLDYGTVSYSQLKEYLLFNAKHRNLGPSTGSRVISVLRLFFSFLNECGLRTDDPTEFLCDTRHAKNLPRTVDNAQIEKILEVIDCSQPAGCRDRALIELIYSCGLRVSECCSLKLKDYYREERKIIVTGKGDKQRMVPVGERAETAIEEYISCSRPHLLGRKKSEYLFVSQNRMSVTRQEVWIRLKKYASLCGIDLTVHTLRHSYASQMIKHGADLRTVQELLGHSDIRTTEIYTHVSTDDLYEAYRKYHS